MPRHHDDDGDAASGDAKRVRRETEKQDVQVLASKERELVRELKKAREKLREIVNAKCEEANAHVEAIARELKRVGIDTTCTITADRGDLYEEKAVSSSGAVVAGHASPLQEVWSKALALDKYVGVEKEVLSTFPAEMETLFEEQFGLTLGDDKSKFQDVVQRALRRTNWKLIMKRGERALAAVEKRLKNGVPDDTAVSFTALFKAVDDDLTRHAKADAFAAIDDDQVREFQAAFGGEGALFAVPAAEAAPAPGSAQASTRATTTTTRSATTSSDRAPDVPPESAKLLSEPMETLLAHERSLAKAGKFAHGADVPIRLLDVAEAACIVAHVLWPTFFPKEKTKLRQIGYKLSKVRA